VPSWIMLFAAHGLYNRRALFGGTAEYRAVFNACTLGLVVVIIVTFIEPNIVISRGWLLLAWLSALLLTTVWRFAMRRFIYALRRRKLLLQNVIILGANGEGRAVALQFHTNASAGVRVIGFIDDALEMGTQVLPGVPVLGPASAFHAIVEHAGADTVIIADTHLVRDRLTTIYGAIAALRRLDVCLAPGLFELLTIGVSVREQGSVPLLALNRTRITGPHALGKLLIDRLGSLAALIILSPLLAAIAWLIYREDGGPIVYRRRVVGVGSERFDAFKFRTMRAEGDALLSPQQRAELQSAGKLKHDPRVTRIGRFLRRTSLDELPQLVNVLRGQMSLVGPRMITEQELAHFGRWQHNLLTVPPGLTGLWQVSGRSDLGYSQRVQLDMHYIRNYSIWLDLQIMFQTLPIIISGRGAY
jgi:exopolysaccharide biosynthesis polyprenyl glycosylphosphotransferase